MHALCYRMMGSLADADDALQEALLGAWKGIAQFEGRATLRTWLYRIATNACLQLIARRPRRELATERGPASTGVDVEPFVDEPVWLEPYPDDPQALLEQRESLELAFVAALQHLPANQRAVLILRDVLELSAAEVAELLDTSVASITSALQRARQTVATRVPPRSQAAELRALGDDGQRALVDGFIGAWERQDLDGLLALLTRDARFSMPPIPTWFDGTHAIGRFFRERVFATPWRLRPGHANGQLAFLCYQGPDFRLGAFNVVTLRGGQIAEMTGFLDPQVYDRLVLPRGPLQEA